MVYFGILGSIICSLHSYLTLRLDHRNDAKIAEIYNFWTFWPVVQQISHLLLADLGTKTSRGCRFLLFWHHSYDVTLSDIGPFMVHTQRHNEKHSCFSSFQVTLIFQQHRA